MKVTSFRVSFDTGYIFVLSGNADTLTMHCYSKNEGHCSFILYGDLNARIGVFNDYVYFVHDASRHIDALPEDYIVDTQLSQTTEDKTVNDNCLILIDFVVKQD